MAAPPGQFIYYLPLYVWLLSSNLKKTLGFFGRILSVSKRTKSKIPKLLQVSINFPKYPKNDSHIFFITSSKLLDYWRQKWPGIYMEIQNHRENNCIHVNYRLYSIWQVDWDARQQLLISWLFHNFITIS